MATHEVANQPPPLVDWNLLTTDRALVEALHREGAGWAEGELAALGGRLGEARSRLGTQANRYPRSHAFDRFGRRRDEVEFHPAGTPCSAWRWRPASWQPLADARPAPRRPGSRPLLLKVGPASAARSP
jgi:hypothetical protein